MGWRWTLLLAPVVVIALLLPGCGGGEEAQHDPALVGMWSQTAQTDNGTPVALTEEFLVTLNEEGTYRADADAAGIINWETGTWSTSGDSLAAVCTDSSVPSDIGTHRDFVYEVATGTLTLTQTELVDSVTHTYVSTFRLLAVDPQLVGGWMQTSLTEDGTPVVPLPNFVLTVDTDGTYRADTEDEAGPRQETGQWGAYDTTLVAIARTATSAGDVGKQHIAAYVVSGESLTLTYTDTEDSVEHDYVAVFSRLALDANLVGRWEEILRTENGVDVSAEQNFLLTVNDDGTYRADMDEFTSISWETGTWGTAGTTLVAHCTDASSASDIGKTHITQYAISGDTLTLTYTDYYAAAPITVVIALVRLVGLDPALVGAWSQTSQTDNGTPVVLEENFLLTINEDGTFRGDFAPVEITLPVRWESGNLTTSSTSASPTWFLAMVTDASDPADIGRQHFGAYTINGTGGQLVLAMTESIDGVPHALVMTFAPLGLDSAVLGTWNRTALIEDGVPVVPTPSFTLIVLPDGTFSTVEGSDWEDGDWGTYGGNVIVPIVRSASDPTHVGRQHISAYALSDGGNTLTLTTVEVESGTPHTYINILTKS